jgi:hypothetical protein
MTKTDVIDTDVLVCGGGCAGLGAALAAARNGAKTLLIERAGFAGGIITSVGLPYFDGIADKATRKIVVGGIPLEFLVKMDVCPADAVTLATHNPTINNTERFKLLADQLLAEQADRLRVLYHTLACDVMMRGDRIEEVRVANKAGLVSIRPKVVVDCTGDADVAAWSGAPFEKAESLQPMTMHFRIGNVKRQADMSQRCRESVIQAHQEGAIKLFYGPGLIFNFAPDEAYIHAIRVPGDATDPEALTRAEIQGRIDAWTMFERWKKEVPGFEDAYFITSGPFIGVRETRRIVGKYVLTEEDIRAERQFDDAIATGCWYLDLHPNDVTVGTANKEKGFQPGPYDIPYGTILPQKVRNLLVAGRCHSATRQAASSTRVTVTAMALGQAAGVAAAMSAEEGKSPQELAGTSVRRTLEQQHAGPCCR